MSLHKDWLIDFIEIYKEEPCLWQLKSKQYHNKQMKNAAYSRLVHKMKEVDSRASVETVKAKINTLRGSFRREYLKVQSSQQPDSGMSEVYKPTLWYYDMLTFLAGEDVLRTPRAKLLNKSEPEDMSDDDDSSFHQPSSHLVKMEEVYVGENKAETNNSLYGSSNNSSSQYNPPNEDEDYLFGMFVSSKLKKVSNPQQKMLAETMIVRIVNKAITNDLSDD